MYTNARVCPGHLQECLLAAPSPDASCRVCQEGQRAEIDLLSPCHCEGSVKYVCRSCLHEWSQRDEWSRFRCELCGFVYVFEIERASRADTLHNFTRDGVEICRQAFLWAAIAMGAGAWFPLWKWPREMICYMGSLIFVWVVVDVFASFQRYGVPWIGVAGRVLRRIFRCDESEVVLLLYADAWRSLAPYELAGEHRRQPQEHQPPREGVQEHHAKDVCKAIGSTAVMALSLTMFPFIWGPAILKYVMTHKEEADSIGLTLTISSATYVCVLTILQVVALFWAPPLQLRRDCSGNPIVRSLLPSERVA